MTLDNYALGSAPIDKLFVALFVFRGGGQRSAQKGTEQGLEVDQILYRGRLLPADGGGRPKGRPRTAPGPLNRPRPSSARQPAAHHPEIRHEPQRTVIH